MACLKGHCHIYGIIFITLLLEGTHTSQVVLGTTFYSKPGWRFLSSSSSEKTGVDMFNLCAIRCIASSKCMWFTYCIGTKLCQWSGEYAPDIEENAEYTGGWEYNKVGIFATAKCLTQLHDAAVGRKVIITVAILNAL